MVQLRSGSHGQSWHLGARTSSASMYPGTKAVNVRDQTVDAIPPHENSHIEYSFALGFGDSQRIRVTS